MTLAVSSAETPWGDVGIIMLDSVGYTILAFLIGMAAIERLEIPTRPAAG